MDPLVAEELDSSPDPDSQDVEASEPSSSSDVETTMEDAIRSVLQESAPDEDYEDADPEESTDSSAGEVVGDPETEEPIAEGLTDEQILDELAALKDPNLPLGKIERFRQMVEEKNQLRQDLEVLSPVKGQLEEIQRAGMQAGLSQEQLTTLFSIPLLMANDPDQAVTAIEEMRGMIAQKSGHELAPELQQKVEDGYMDEESARELSKARAQAEANARRAEQVEYEAQAERQQVGQQSIVNAVNTFQSSLKESDPDYDRKHKYVRLELAEIVKSRGAPENPETAVAWAKEAHESVSKDLSAFKPKPRAARPLSGRGTSNRQVSAQPASMYEAISAAVGGVTED